MQYLPAIIGPNRRLRQDHHHTLCYSHRWRKCVTLGDPAFRSLCPRTLFTGHQLVTENSDACLELVLFGGMSSLLAVEISPTGVL